MENQDNKKIVVLQVLPELGQGGVELGTIEIASELQKRGIENYVASEGGRMEYNLERSGLECLLGGKTLRRAFCDYFPRYIRLRSVGY